MRAQLAGVFALGFAAGVSTLGVAVWRWGAAVQQVSEIPVVAPPTLPAPLPVTSPAVAPPSVPAPPPATGTADRVVSEGRPRLHLAMPLAGVSPSNLVESFRQGRNGRSHEAIDIPAPRGTPVLAVAEGTVAKLFTSKPGGLTVYQFDNTQTYCFYYAHLDRYQPGLKEGTRLRKGEVLGYVGTTGNAPPNTPHLHLAVFELGPEKKWWKGNAIDPLPLLK